MSKYALVGFSVVLAIAGAACSNGQPFVPSDGGAGAGGGSAGAGGHAGAGGDGRRAGQHGRVGARSQDRAGTGGER